MNRLLIILASVAFLSSCEHLTPHPNKKMPLVNIEDPSEQDTNNIVFEQQSNEALAGDAEKAQKDEFYRGTGRFVGSTRKPGKSKTSSESGKFTLNFEDAALSEVIKVILSDTLNESYMVNPKVIGKVTLQTSRPLTREELLPTLELLLQVNNAALIRDETMYRIEPLSSALKAGVAPGMARKASSGYQVQIIPLQYVGVEEMQEILKPTVSATAIVRADKARNLLMVAGTAKELEGIKQTVATFDVDYMQGMSFGIFPLHNSDVETINKELEEVFSSADGSPMAGMFKLVPIERMNAILAITPQPRYLNKIKLWISRLDKAASAAGGGVVVYRVQHAKADELAATLNEIFTGGEKKKTKAPSVAPGRTATKISSRKKKTTDKKKTQRTVASSKSKSTDISGISEVKIIADVPNNTIIVVATPQEYETIKAVIKELDVMPLQVLIEATIIEVRLTDKTKYGVSWGFGSQGDITTSTTTGDNPTTTTTGDAASRGLAQLGSLATSAATAAGTGGFSYVISNAANTVQAAIDAFGTGQNVNVLSAPSLLVLNNQEASIHVGDKVPKRGNTTPAGGVTDNLVESIEQEETGVTLSVTPRVNANGVVIMDIEQENNTATVTTTSSIDSPTIVERKLKSIIAIHSGETVVLGGLINETYDDATTGIPWFKDLPYIGPLFGVTEREKKKSELIVLITPRVVQNKTDARQVTREYQLRLPSLYEIEDNLKDISEDLKQLKEHQNYPN